MKRHGSTPCWEVVPSGSSGAISWLLIRISIVRFRFFGNDIKSMKTSSLSNCSDRLDAFYSFDFLYSVPQISIASIMGRMDSPKSERAYSTLGGYFGIDGTGNDTIGFH